jgi:FAD/FMN-containing dehydrogenase
VLTLGGGQRKDNSTLPLRQLFVGSCGALGVITRVSLEVHHRPSATAAALLVPAKAKVLELLAAVEAAAGESLTAFEGMSAAAMRRALAHVPGLRNPFPGGAVPGYAVLIELTRSAAPLERQPTLDDDLEAMLVEIAGRPGSPLADAFIGPSDHLWALRHALPEGLRASGPVFGFDLSFRRSQLFRFRHAAVAMLAREFPQHEICDFGHIADGGVHFNIVRREPALRAADDYQALKDCVLGLAVEEFGASFSGEHGLGRANQDAYDRFVPPAVQAYSTALAGLFSEVSPAAMRLGPARQPSGDAAC